MAVSAKIWKEDIQGFDPWYNSGKYYFDVKTANRVLTFFGTEIKHSKGAFAGKPFKLERWEKKIIGHLFGWKRKKDNTRRFRKIFVYVPRKNGKSTLLAAVGIVLLVADGEPGAEIYSAAADVEQANLVFAEASNMVAQNDTLSREIKVLKGYKSMKHELSMSYWKVLSSEAGTKHGLNPHAYMIDELHAQKNNELVEALETGLGARRQPVGVYITTADYAKDSPCNRLYRYAQNVRDKAIDDPYFLPVIYETIEGVDDWNDPAVWKKVNPNLEVSVSLDFLESQHQKALNEPSYENVFKRLHLNMQTKQETKWLSLVEWDACGDDTEERELVGKRCFASVDLSSSIDIASLVLFFPEYCACLCYFWVPKDTADKKIEYEMWAKQGHISVSKERTIDYRLIEQKIIDLKELYDIQMVAYDPWNASQFSVTMSDTHGFAMVEFRQGFISMNEPSKEFEKLIIKRKLNHFNNPVLRWMAENVNIKEDPSGNIKPVKPNSRNSPLKIDGIIALIMAIGVSLTERVEDVSFSESENFEDLMKEVYGGD